MSEKKELLTIIEMLAELPPATLATKSAGLVLLWMTADYTQTEDGKIADSAMIGVTSTVPESVAGAMVCVVHDVLHPDENDEATATEHKVH